MDTKVHNRPNHTNSRDQSNKHHFAKLSIPTRQVFTAKSMQTAETLGWQTNSLQTSCHFAEGKGTKKKGSKNSSRGGGRISAFRIISHNFALFRIISHGICRMWPDWDHLDHLAHSKYLKINKSCPCSPCTKLTACLPD